VESIYLPSPSTDMYTLAAVLSLFNSERLGYIHSYISGWHLYVSCETGLKLAPKGVPKFNGGIHFNTGHRDNLLYWVLDYTYPKLA
jgi:hypothetical protein